MNHQNQRFLVCERIFSNLSSPHTHETVRSGYLTEYLCTPHYFIYCLASISAKITVSFSHCCVGESGVLGLADALQKGAVIECVDLSGNAAITAHAVAALASVARGTCIQYVELGADDEDDDSNATATDAAAAIGSASASASATGSASAPAAVSRSQSHEWTDAARALSNQLFRNRTERGLHAATDAHHIIGVDNEDHNEQELRRLQQFGCGCVERGSEMLTVIVSIYFLFLVHFLTVCTCT
jgi:hypothetical protein